MQHLGNRWRTQAGTTKTVDELPYFTTQASGRANNVPDYYSADVNNFAPRVASEPW